MNDHSCVLPVRSPYKSIHPCSCGARWICIGEDYHPLTFLPYSIYKATVATERWPMWLRILG